MTKIKERRMALSLRKEGKSYSQIKKKLKLSKSTLSRWLVNFPLSKNQIRQLRDINQERIEKYRQTMMIKRNKKLNKYYMDAKKTILQLSERELHLAGIFLYWGEGNKASRNTISISNSDPNLLKFSVYWLIKSMKVPRKKLKALLHLYRDMDIKEERNYWAEMLDIPLENFSKPFIKETKRLSVDHKGFGHGTCSVIVNNTEMKERLLAAIKVICDIRGRLT